MPPSCASSRAPVPDILIREAFVPAEIRRRVLVHAPLAYSTLHFETDLERSTETCFPATKFPIALRPGRRGTPPPGNPRRCRWPRSSFWSVISAWKNWFSYTKQQESGREPADWDRSARRIVEFTSCDFEFAAIGGDATGKDLSPSGRRHPPYRPIVVQAESYAPRLVRVHPNDNNPANVKCWTAKCHASARSSAVAMIPCSTRSIGIPRKTGNATPEFAAK